MRTLAGAKRRVGPAIQQLPTVFPTLEQAGIRLRRGTVTMIAATPASLKSMLTLYWVGRMGLPTLFFSADTDEYESMKRATAMVTGETQDQIEAGIAAGVDYAPALTHLSHIRWVFETDPTYRDLELETAAFAEAYGQFPSIIVIDNLMNVVPENDNEWMGMRDTTKALKRLVRITGSSVFVLHHNSESEKDNSKPAARVKLQGKVSQLPEVILSIARSDNEMRIAAVKNRFGPGDASGERYVTLYVDPSRCTFYLSRHDMQSGRAA